MHKRPSDKVWYASEAIGMDDQAWNLNLEIIGQPVSLIRTFMFVYVSSANLAACY